LLASFAVNSRWWFLPLLFFVFSPLSGKAADQDAVSEPADPPPVFARPMVYLDLVASTWKPRGRSSLGIVPLIRNKLDAAGYRVTQDASAPRDATLTVRYREERGKRISTSLYGTHLFCTVTFARSGDSNNVQLAIEERPQYRDLISAPYVEVMESFQTNPYFYYLGPVIQGWMSTNQEPTASLIDALDRDLYPVGVPEPTPMDTLLSPSETFADLNEYYAPEARARTIQEVGRLRDSRGLDLLLRLTTHEDRLVRAEALRALEGFDRSVVRPAVLHAADSDADHTVRETARAMLERLPE